MSTRSYALGFTDITLVTLVVVIDTDVPSVANGTTLVSYHQHDEKADKLVVGVLVGLAYTSKSELHPLESLYTTSVAQVTQD